MGTRLLLLSPIKLRTTTAPATTLLSLMVPSDPNTSPRTMELSMLSSVRLIPLSLSMVSPLTLLVSTLDSHTWSANHVHWTAHHLCWNPCCQAQWSCSCCGCDPLWSGPLLACWCVHQQQWRTSFLLNN